MKIVTTNKFSYKFTVMFVAVAIANLLLLPQVPKTFAYFTSSIKSDEITFSYRPIQTQVVVRYDEYSSMVYLSFPNFEMDKMGLTSAELSQVKGMKLTASEFSHVTSDYTLYPIAWDTNGNEMVLYLTHHKVIEWLTKHNSDDLTFYVQISGEANYKGARVLFTGRDPIRVNVPESVLVGLPTGGGELEPVMPPEELLEELPEGSEELPDEQETDGMPDETMPEEPDLTVPAPEDDPVTELPSKKPSEEPAIPGDPSEEPLKKEEPSQEIKETPKAAEAPPEEETSSKNTTGEEPASQGGETP